jgi:translocation and assembly module TamB
VLSRILVAAGLAAAVVFGAAIAFLRTEFVANNLCAYAVATIEEATAARVRVSRCSVQPEQGKLTIEGLKVGDPGGRIDLEVDRVFAQVKVRPLLQRVRLERLEVDHPRLRLALDQAGASPPSGGQCLPDLLDRFEFGRVKVRKASVEVHTARAHLVLPHAGLSLKGKGSRLSVGVSTRAGSLELPGRTVGLVSSRVAGIVDLKGSGSVDLRRGDVIGVDGSAFLKGKLQNLCNPQIDLAANVRFDDLESASAHLIPGVLRTVKGGVSADATVSVARGAPHLKGDLRLRGVVLDSFVPGDARLRFDLTPARVKVDRLEVPVGHGQVNGSVELSLADSSLPLSADLMLRDMELADLLRKLGLPRAWVVLRTSGRVQVKGTLAPFRLGGETALELADFAVLDRSYEKRAQAKKMLEFARGKLAGEVAVDAEKIVARAVTVEVGASRMQVESTFFTDVQRGMQLAAQSEGIVLDDFLGHIGPLPARGTLKLSARVAGPYSALSIEGNTAAQGVRFMELSLGEVTTRVGFDARSMKLSFAEIRGRKDRSAYLGRIAVDFRTAATPIDAHLEVPDGRVHDLIDLAVGLVPTLSAVQDPDEVDGHLSSVIDVKGPVAGPDGTASLRFDHLELWGESFAVGEARLSLHGQEPRLQIEKLELRHGDAAVRLSGGFGPDWKLQMDGASENFDLADLDLATAAKLSGPLSATARIRGVAAHPLIDVGVKFAEGMSGEADIGEGDLSLKIDGKAMALKGKVGTHAVAVDARLEGEFPYTASATVRLPDLAEYLDLFLPDANIQGGSLAGSVELKGSLRRWRESSGVLTLSQLKVLRSDLAFENDGPAEVSFGPDGVRTPRLALRAPYTTVQLSGGRTHDGTLDLRLTANIDGRVLAGVVPDLEHASGRYLMQATVSGTAKRPTVLGNIRVEDGALTLRGLPVAARSLNGSISFSQDALVIDALSGTLNNGEARVSGGMEMERLVPRKIDISAHVSEVNVKLQESLSTNVDGDLTLYGDPYEPVLGGNLNLSQIKYTEDIDLERSLLDLSRRPPTPKVLAKSAVVVRFDLDVHLSRAVRLENNLARADLKGDLKVTGTSRALGLLGSVNTVHGTATFRGNEFQIEQGVLTFTDRQRIRPSFDLQANSQVTYAGQVYKIRLHAFGTPGEPHVSLTSDPALADADIGFLLTFGFVSRDLQQSAFSAADSGLAIGIEALNKATGFSEEVRRFIPKNAILRDPNIDFASDFSSATNRLEPMARFQSHLISDRLDLKVLEGLTTRRYRGVISYQLSDSLSTRFQLDNEHVTTGTGTDFGVDLHLQWEGD